MSTALIAGEVLFDLFEDGSEVLGGAPFNVAWHLQGLGFNPLFVSSVGTDSRGDEIRTAMQSWGMDITGLQTDTHHPTGTVQVKLENGIPSFDIVADAAYDFIETIQSAGQAENCKLMYHGSLALRSATTKQTILQLREQSKLPVFVDVNLRAPYWSPSLVNEIITGATWVKLNDEELMQLSKHNTSDLVSCAQQFRKQHQLQTIIVTQGKEGAFLVTDDVLEKVKPAPVENLVDTVGAGDGFSAMTIAGLLQGWDHREILEAASLFASRICGLRGALTNDRTFYDDFLDEIH